MSGQGVNAVKEQERAEGKEGKEKKTRTENNPNIRCPTVPLQKCVQVRNNERGARGSLQTPSDMLS